MATGKKLRQFVVAEAKDEEVGAVAVWTAVLSPDGRVLVLKHTDEVTLWETATGKQLHRIKDNGECCQFAFSPDGKMLALLTMGFTLRFHRCEVATGKDVQHLLLNREGDALLKMRGDRAPRCLVWSPDGRLLATTDDDGTIYLLEAATGEERGQLRGHQGPLHALAFSADGKRLLSASADRTALVWDVRQGLRTLRER